MFKRLGNVLKREILLSSRQFGFTAQLFIFLVIGIVLFAMGFNQASDAIRESVPALLWFLILLATTLVASSWFRDDYDNGWLAQWVMCDIPLSLLILVKQFFAWIQVLVTLILFIPLSNIMLNIEYEKPLLAYASFAIGTAILVQITSVTAVLSLLIGRSSVLHSIVTLPLTIPVLIFGAEINRAALDASSNANVVWFLMAIAAFVWSIGPWTTATALRMSLE
ncbi:MAG: heme exporter protein CcmB [Pseudomonadota bacterium]